MLKVKPSGHCGWSVWKGSKAVNVFS